MTVRLRLSRRAGFKLPPGAMSVAYPTPWKNPHRPAVRSAAANAEAVRLFRVHLAEQLAADPAFLEPLRQATGLACWCPLDLSCHVDVLIEAMSEARSPDGHPASPSRRLPPVRRPAGRRGSGPAVDSAAVGAAAQPSPPAAASAR